MALSIKELEREALQLTASEREKLASSLLQSTNNQEISDIDKAWLLVAEERYQALKSGQDEGISESDFLKKIEANLGWK
ncbi:MAG: addiction module protein [Verrucomicrobia bacterium]|nr:addiction module protein [Verrucomicrobiota bacterium]